MILETWLKPSFINKTEPVLGSWDEIWSPSTWVERPCAMNWNSWLLKNTSSNSKPNQLALFGIAFRKYRPYLFIFERVSQEKETRRKILQECLNKGWTKDSHWSKLQCVFFMVNICLSEWVRRITTRGWMRFCWRALVQTPNDELRLSSNCIKP